jgi:hypothetical protein
MRKSIVTVAVLLALAIPARSSAADTTRWLTYPSCSATTTSLTCTGKGAGLQRPENNPLGVGLGPPEAAIIGQVHYICNIPGEPGFTVSWPGGRFDDALAVTDFHNGQTFSIEYLPPPQPEDINDLFACGLAGGTYTRDPNYYDVSVAIGFGFGSGNAVTLLSALIGTVSPG